MVTIGRLGLHDNAHLHHAYGFSRRRPLPPDILRHIMNRVVTAALVPSSLSALTTPVDSLCDPRLRLLAELLAELLENVLEELLLDEDSELGDVDPDFGWHVRLAELSASESVEAFTDVSDGSDWQKSGSLLSSTAT